MTNRFFIAFLLGLVSSVVFVSATTGPVVMRFILFLITSLPIFLAGLGWGTAAGLIAALTGSAIAGLFSWKAGLLFAASQGLPAVILSHLALLSRDVPSSDGTTAVREWYPAGRLLVIAALLSAVPSVIWLFMFGGDLAALKTTLGPAISELVKAQMPAETPLSAEDLDKITGIIVNLLPAATAIAWMLALLVNLWLAGRIVTATGNFARPWPDLAAITYPQWTPLALAATTALAVLGGWIGTAASGFAATLLLAYVLLGLAVIHFVSRGMPWRPFLLWGLYASLLVVNAPLTLPLALLGLAESLFHFRARAAARTGPPKS